MVVIVVIIVSHRGSRLGGLWGVRRQGSRAWGQEFKGLEVRVWG